MGLGLGRLGPLEVTLRRASHKLIVSLNNTLAEWRELLERRGSEINLVGGTASAVVNDTDNDGTLAMSDLCALEAGCLLTALVVGHVDGADHPGVTGVDVRVVL